MDLREKSLMVISELVVGADVSTIVGYIESHEADLKELGIDESDWQRAVQEYKVRLYEEVKNYDPEDPGWYELVNLLVDADFPGRTNYPFDRLRHLTFMTV